MFAIRILSYRILSYLIAPEVVTRLSEPLFDGRGVPNFLDAVDSYAVGVITIEMISGCRPFERPTKKETIEAITQGDYICPRKLSRECEVG